MTLNNLFKQPQYSLSRKEKNRLLLPLLKDGIEGAIRKNRFIRAWCKKVRFNPDSIYKIEDIPFLPVQMFKYFDLGFIESNNVARVLESSGTTEKAASKVPLDKITMRNQTNALMTTLKPYIGEKRKVFLVFDHPGENQQGLNLKARGAGIRGFELYSSKTYYLLKSNSENKISIDWDTVSLVSQLDEKVDTYCFGFTFIIWSKFVSEYQEKSEISKGLPRLKLSKSKLFHSGGWKKLNDQSVTKESFVKKLTSLFSIEADNVYDFYGMAEQGGLVFIDCEEGFKHVPNCASIVIRDPYRLEPCDNGEIGLIQVLSPLAASYFSYSILTEDLGLLRGTDDCPCGRKGEYFEFVSRIEKSEERGCGDTFREK
jgi:phenylacetate-coenzyme A ligase PaaK-like adenylate-forming protein